MREYKQLTEEERIEIYAMKQAGKEQKTIAAILGVHPGTISRELARNTGLRGYRPKQAQQKALVLHSLLIFNLIKSREWNVLSLPLDIDAKKGADH